jgi:hypothetical protein
MKRCTGLLLNCSLAKGHRGYCAPLPPKERTSPCAAKCRHKWCAGYEAGYSDGQEYHPRTP